MKHLIWLFLVVIVVVSLATAGDEIKRVPGGKVQFFVTKDHTLQPVLPITFRVNQYEGGIADPGEVLTCEIYSQSISSKYHGIVLGCGNRDFIILNTVFSAYQEKPKL